MKATYTTVSNAAFYDVLREDSEQGETNWTVNKGVHPGDRILLYICKPVLAIVAAATVSTEPQLDDNINSEWFGHYLVDMHDLRMLSEPIKRETLLERFPAWGYWKQPRNSIKVPEPYAEQITLLVR